MPILSILSTFSWLSSIKKFLGQLIPLAIEHWKVTVILIIVLVISLYIWNLRDEISDLNDKLADIQHQKQMCENSLSGQNQAIISFANHQITSQKQMDDVKRQISINNGTLKGLIETLVNKPPLTNCKDALLELHQHALQFNGDKQ